MKTRTLFGLVLCVAVAFLLTARPVIAQTPISPTQPRPADTAMIFQPSHPLIQSAEELAKEYPNSWGFNISFSDYGFGGGFFLGHEFNSDFSGMFTLDIGTAEGAREVDLLVVNKINRIFVLPFMLGGEYRVFHSGLSDNLRPYIAAGAGPVVAMTTPYNEDFFSAFGNATTKILPGGFVGLGANFGNDPKGNFGASLRYFYIPVPGGIQSTTTESLPNLDGLYLTASYSFNF